MIPNEIFAALHRAADAACGARLFTVTVLDRKAGLARRAYSSHPVEYPVTGTKPITDSPWTEQVLGRAERFVANSTQEFAPYFPDHALINSLGCESALNIPVSERGIVIGTVNVLDKAGHFDTVRIAALEAVVATHRDALIKAFPLVPMEETRMTRLDRLRARMRATDTDLMALAPGAHLQWLLGFAPPADERPCLLLVGSDKAGFLMPALNAGDVRQHTDLPFFEWQDATGPDAALEQALAEISPSPRALALDETMRADHALLLLDGLPNVRRDFTGPTLGALRMIKDAEELAALQENARIADLAQSALRAAIRDGITERELAEVA